MSFWKKRKPQHPPASSLLDDPVSNQEVSTLPPPAIPSTRQPEAPPSNRRSLEPVGTTTRPTETSPSPPVRSSSSGRRPSRFNLFRRASSRSVVAPPPTSNPEGNIVPKGHTSPTTYPATGALRPAPIIKTPDNPNTETTSPPRIRARNRTPTGSPYASPRTSIYGALSSPSSSSGPTDIFERSIESVPSVSTRSPSVKGVPTHQVLEDMIPPALEATASTFNDHIDPDNIEIVTFSEVHSIGSRSNAGSPAPSSPVFAAPVEAIQNPWEQGSPKLEGEKRTLNLMSAVDHLADEIIHPVIPSSVEIKPDAVSPMSLSPRMKPADVTHPTAADLSMERCHSQASIGEAVVKTQNMGEVLREQRLHSAAFNTAHNVDSRFSAPTVVSVPSDLDKGGRRDELEANPWNQ